LFIALIRFFLCVSFCLVSEHKDKPTFSSTESKDKVVLRAEIASLPEKASLTTTCKFDIEQLLGGKFVAVLLCDSSLISSPFSFLGALCFSEFLFL
jgi:hypothetical protein